MSLESATARVKYAPCLSGQGVDGAVEIAVENQGAGAVEHERHFADVAGTHHGLDAAMLYDEDGTYEEEFDGALKDEGNADQRASRRTM